MADASRKGTLYCKRLPITSSPESVCKTAERELPMDLTRESVGYTDSVEWSVAEVKDMGVEDFQK